MRLLAVTLLGLSLLAGLYCVLLTLFLREYPHDRSRHASWEDPHA